MKSATRKGRMTERAVKCTRPAPLSGMVTAATVVSASAAAVVPASVAAAPSVVATLVVWAITAKDMQAKRARTRNAFMLGKTMGIGQDNREKRGMD